MKIPTYQSSVGIQNGSGGSGGQYQPVSAFMRGNGEAMPQDLRQHLVVEHEIIRVALQIQLLQDRPREGAVAGVVFG